MFMPKQGACRLRPFFLTGLPAVLRMCGVCPTGLFSVWGCYLATPFFGPARRAPALGGAFFGCVPSSCLIVDYQMLVMVLRRPAVCPLYTREGSPGPSLIGPPAVRGVRSGLSLVPWGSICDWAVCNGTRDRSVPRFAVVVAALVRT